MEVEALQSVIAGWNLLTIFSRIWEQNPPVSLLNGKTITRGTPQIIVVGPHIHNKTEIEGITALFQPTAKARPLQNGLKVLA
jgi:hypothetical protein